MTPVVRVGGIVAVVVVAVVVLAMGRPRFHDAIYAAYEYRGPGNHVFHPVPIRPEGIVVHDGLWTIDTPEDPDSILALLTYADWNARTPLDLTGRTAVIRLAGDLELHGGYVTFWIIGAGNRWHLEEPLAVPAAYALDLSGSWHRSWSWEDASLEESLHRVDSYGLAFVGFSEKVTGRLVVEEFRFE